jgi:hypothetical protein
MNPWVEHLRACAKTNKISYGCAIVNPLCKSSYREDKIKTRGKQMIETASMFSEDVIAGERRFEENFSKMLAEAEKREAIRLSKISMNAKRQGRQVIKQLDSVLIPTVMKRRERLNMMLEDKIATEIRFEENFAKMLAEAEAKDAQKRERMSKLKKIVRVEQPKPQFDFFEL